jgi:hypothetical protein
VSARLAYILLLLIAVVGGVLAAGVLYSAVSTPAQ